MNDHDDILDDLFHGVALAAFVEESCLVQAYPSIERTRCRAYAYYEDAIKSKLSSRRPQRASSNANSC
jgi:hypothetical protein